MCCSWMPTSRVSRSSRAMITSTSSHTRYVLPGEGQICTCYLVLYVYHVTGCVIFASECCVPPVHPCASVPLVGKPSDSIYESVVRCSIYTIRHSMLQPSRIPYPFTRRRFSIMFSNTAETTHIPWATALATQNRSESNAAHARAWVPGRLILGCTRGLGSRRA